MINLRNALMARKRLPYDAEVEYLESTGSQYIQVPMVVDNSATVNITGYTGISNTELFSFDMERKKSFNIESGATYYRWWTDNYINLGSGYVGSLHSYKCNSSIWVDGVLKGTSTATDTDKTTAFYIFKGVHNPARGRIYHASVEYGGALIFDGIPVRVGTVGYLYDRVSGKLFGNAGTGDFVLGQDVVPVEWLGFTGTQYIYTGFDITNATSFAYEIKYDLAETITNAEPRIISNEGAGSGAYYDICYSLQHDKLYVRQSGKSIYPVRNKPIVSIMTEQGRYYGYYEESPQSLLYDGTRAFVAPTTVQQYKIGAKANSSQDQYKHEGRIYYGLFTKDGSPAKRFYSVRVGTEGAMMDVLTRRIYRNQGTGAFTYGNDLKYPIPSE